MSITRIQEPMYNIQTSLKRKKRSIGKAYVFKYKPSAMEPLVNSARTYRIREPLLICAQIPRLIAAPIPFCIQIATENNHLIHTYRGTKEPGKKHVNRNKDSQVISEGV